ncbi:geranylgeranyl pyrophosphate synthase-like [Aricia agestis]|uniref:geranylgeranyl pyrophosphate synthase-like n=1 Tax=Aricia agestis TaxID=91739 RepID=UPI001C20BCDF|nr:geranylgeranyl pyrophosphate synthase-like [Aricia agestis]
MNQIQHTRESIVEEIIKPFHYIRQVKSNPVIAYYVPEAFNYWLKIPKHILEEIQEIADQFSNVTFLFDDIQDDSKIRRGIPTANIAFGTNLAINACFQAYTQLILRVGKLHKDATNIFLTQANCCLIGQGADIFVRENIIVLSEDDYKWMATQKSSETLYCPILLMQLFSEDKRDYRKLMMMFGVYYEIRDDYCNLVNMKEVDGKCNADKYKEPTDLFCEDFTDGKFSFPVNHALRTSHEASPIIYALKQRTTNYKHKKYCLDLLKKLGSLDYTLKVIRAMDKEMREEVKRLGGNPKFIAVLDDLYI